MKITALAIALISAGFLTIGAGTANAQATRTWVSGVGDDANPCSRTAPCKTWAGAISKTAPGGEIDALDPGGFGAVTITKAITLDGGGGQVASVLVAGTNGINVSAGVNDVVIIRNIRFNGLLGSASPGVVGIKFNSGKSLMVENCEVFGFSTAGISVNTAAASNTVIARTAVTNSTTGILVNPTAGTAKVAISYSQVNLNSSNGIQADGTAGGGVSVTISDTHVGLNGADGILSKANPGTVGVAVMNSRIVGNATNGIESNGSNSAVLVANSLVTLNATGVLASNSGALLSYTDNIGNGNTTSDGTYTQHPMPN